MNNINLQKDDDILYSDQLLHEKLKQMKQTRKQHVSTSPNVSKGLEKLANIILLVIILYY